MLQTQRWDTAEYAALDLELTGNIGKNTGRPGICEIGGVHINGGKVDAQNVFVTLVNPMQPSSSQAWKIHGIPYADLREAPPIHILAKPLKSFLHGRILIAHDARVEFGAPRRGISNLQLPTIFDTLLLAKKLLSEKRGYSLGNLLESHDDLFERIESDFNPKFSRQHYDGWKKQHSAYYDGLAAAHLFVWLMEKHMPLATIDEIAAICAYRRELERASP